LPELVYAAAAATCARCGTEIAPGLLACPSCGRLVFAEDLAVLASEAESAESADNRELALGLWRQVLSMVPPGTRQYQEVGLRVFRLEHHQEPKQARTSGTRSGRTGLVAGVGAGLIFVFSKLKFLVLGFTKLGSLSGLLLSFGVYWAAYGWALAATAIASIYAHELGHVWKLRRYGIPVSAPMFVPAMGAFVTYPAIATRSQQTRVALWGPVWGLGAAAVATGLHAWTGAPLWALTARLGAAINLLNLAPVWVLDGKTAFDALSMRQRLAVVTVGVAATLFTRDRWILVLVAGCGWRVLQEAPKEGDGAATAIFILLIAGLSAVGLVFPTLPALP
jgi:Zn-dependent protease